MFCLLHRKFRGQFFFSFSCCQIIWFCVIELLGNYIFKFGDCFFLWKSPNGFFFSDFEPCRRNYMSKKMMQQWGSWSVCGTYNSFSALLQWLFFHFCVSNLHDKTTIALAIKAKHQLLSFECFASQQKTVFSWDVDK